MVAGEEKVAVNGLDSRLEQGCRWGSGRDHDPDAADAGALSVVRTYEIW